MVLTTRHGGGAVELNPVRRRYQAKPWWFVAHELEGREIPPLEETPILPVAIQQAGTMANLEPLRVETGLAGTLVPAAGTVPAFWGEGAVPLALEGNGTHYVIVNMGRLVTGYPRVALTAPKGTWVEFRYAEALSRNYKKTVRDDPAGTVEGYYDLFFTPKARLFLSRSFGGPFVFSGLRCIIRAGR